MKYWIFILVVLGFVVGCKGYVPRGFLPPPSQSEEWIKEGASHKDVIIALLECGFSAPDRRSDYPMTWDEVAWASYCMENDGFTLNSGSRNMAWRWMCKDKIDGAYVDAGLAACQPGAAPPMRDVNRRLNSKFCRDRPERNSCQ
jgi:hypothetical protein